MDSQPRPLADTDDCLDWGALTHRCLGRTELAARTLVRFTETVPGELIELNRAMQNGDRETVMKITHRIKGASLTISANRLANSLLALEQSDAKENVILENLVTRVDEEFRALSEQIDQLLRTVI